MKIWFLLVGIWLTPNVYGQDLPEGLTVLDQQSAERMFNEILTRKEIPFLYPAGCHAKAQKIALLLEERGVISGKAFIEGYLFRNSPIEESFWLFHVAPIVLVRTESGPLPFVIDGLVASRLLPYPEWLARVTSDYRSHVFKTYFTSRFVYDPSDRRSGREAYDPRFIYDMELVLEQLRVRLKAIGNQMYVSVWR